MNEKHTMTIEEWTARGEALFGPNKMDWRFICPSCGHIADAREYKNAGAPNSALAFSCVGRWKGGDPKKTFKRRGGPCDYAGGGLIGLNPIRVVFPPDPDGTPHFIDVFDFAAPEGNPQK